MTGQTARSRAIHQGRTQDQRIAAMKAEEKRLWDHEVEHFVYRCFDADNNLLYVGCTRDVEARMQVHASSWQNPASAYLNVHMARYVVEGPFVGRLAGRGAEKQAIRDEQPFLNLHHNSGRGAKRERVVITPEELEATTRLLGERLDVILRGKA